jgi:leader peptidase (prepilin peptidase)/N-methyltransferase
MPQLISGLLFVGPLVFAGVSDLRSRTIPYSACILLALAGLISFSPANLFGLLLAVPFFFAAGRGRGRRRRHMLIATAGFVLGLGPGLAGLTSRAFHLPAVCPRR